MIFTSNLNFMLMELKTVFSEKRTTARVQIQGENLLIQGQAVYGGSSDDIKMENGRIFKVGNLDKQIGDSFVNQPNSVQISFYDIEDITLMAEASTLLKQIYDDIKVEAGV